MDRGTRSGGEGRGKETKENTRKNCKRSICKLGEEGLKGRRTQEKRKIEIYQVQVQIPYDECYHAYLSCTNEWINKKIKSICRCDMDNKVQFKLQLHWFSSKWHNDDRRCELSLKNGQSWLQLWKPYIMFASQCRESLNPQSVNWEPEHCVGMIFQGFLHKNEARLMLSVECNLK